MPSQDSNTRPVNRKSVALPTAHIIWTKIIRFWDDKLTSVALPSLLCRPVFHLYLYLVLLSMCPLLCHDHPVPSPLQLSDLCLCLFVPDPLSLVHLAQMSDQSTAQWLRLSDLVLQTDSDSMMTMKTLQYLSSCQRSIPPVSFVVFSRITL